MTQEHKDKIAASLRGLKRSADFKAKVTDGLRHYYKLHPEALLKMSSLNKERGIKPPNRKMVNPFSRTKEYKVIKAQERRGLLRKAEGRFTHDEWLALKAKYGCVCVNCLKPESEVKLTIDHIIPLSKGGSNFISNIQPLCGSCNSKKHDKLIWAGR